MLNNAVIDLSILKENALKVKQKLNTGVKFCAVVKANAYGHGAVEVANAIYNVADCFAVATLEEAIELRYGGIDKEILCLTPFFQKEIDRAISFRITATVSDIKQLKILQTRAKIQKTVANAHLKFNCGMNRQGIDDLKTLKEILDFSLKCKNVNVNGLYSHLSAPENKNVLNSQVNAFLLANNLIKRYNNKVTCHVSASGGFLKGVQADMVRFGILLYGYKPFKSDLVDVKPVMKVYAPVLKQRLIKRGEGALYGNLTAKEDLTFNLIRYGYADGLFRKAVTGQFNNRCMDITAVLGKNNTKWGYPVMINADKLAKQYGTISYEILTKCAFRAQKIYLR